MNGKVIKLNDYKFNFGQETIFLNVFAVFKNIKNGNKYIIYSYDNKKLYCGSAFVKNNEIIGVPIVIYFVSFICKVTSFLSDYYDTLFFYICQLYCFLF